MSYAQDTLHTVEAIFKAFRCSRRPVYSFVGVPIAHPDILRGKSEQSESKLAENDSGQQEILDNHHFPSGRNAKEGFLIGMCWFHHKGSSRRDMFPSWSWAGWEGAVAYSTGITSLMSSTESLSDFDLYVELDDEKTLQFPDFATLPSFLEQCSEQCRYIHIVAPFLEATTIELEGIDLFFIEFDFGPEKGRTRLRMDLDMTWDETPRIGLSGICFGTSSDLWVILVLQSMGTHHERCGIVLTKASEKYENLDFQAMLKDTPKRDIRLG